MAKIVAQTEFGYNSTFLVEMTEQEWKYIHPCPPSDVKIGHTVEIRSLFNNLTSLTSQAKEIQRVRTILESISQMLDPLTRHNLFQTEIQPNE
jgi:hypothetical protein